MPSDVLGVSWELTHFTPPPPVPPPATSPQVYVPLLFPLYKWGSWGTEKLRNIPKVTQLRHGRAGIQAFALEGLHSSVVRPAALSNIPTPGPCRPFQEHKALPLQWASWLFPEAWETLERRERATLWRERESEHQGCFTRVHATQPVLHSGVSGLESRDILVF